MKSQDKNRKCSRQCKDHLFTLRPLHVDAQYRQGLALELCPREVGELQSQTTANKIQAIWPEFNNDGKFYTPAFVLGIDRQQHAANDHHMLQQHLKKVKDYTESKKEMLVPKPSRRHKMCSVCRREYGDYLEHIKSKKHRRELIKSSYTMEILKMCMDLYGNNNRVEIVLDKEQPEQFQNIVIEQTCTTTDQRRTITYEDLDQLQTRSKLIQPVYPTKSTQNYMGFLDPNVRKQLKSDTNVMVSERVEHQEIQAEPSQRVTPTFCGRPQAISADRKPIVIVIDE